MLIAPSLLAADSANLQTAAQNLEAAGADWLHVDCFDGHFVPTLAFSPDTIKAIRPHTDLPLDVHYMAANPHQYIQATAAAGTNRMTIHLEAYSSEQETIAALNAITAAGMAAGIALRTETPIEKTYPFIPHVQTLLLMAVRGGYGGDPFQPTVIKKTKTLSAHLKTLNLSTPPLIAIDGGINAQNAPQLIAAGAQVLCAGSSVFKTNNYAANIKALK